MQGRSRMDRELLDAEAVAGDLVPAGSVFAFLAGHRQELFPDSFTADLFPSATGRPSLPADLVGAVLVLKELHDLSDVQTADALKFDIRWKVACGRSLTQVSFDPSVLVYWRRRIAASERPDRVFGAVAQVIAETGILRGRRKRCVDSTVFDDAVSTQDTVTQLVAAIRRVARVVPGAAEVVAGACKLDYSRPGKPPIDWDDPQAKQDLVSDLVNDALGLLAVLAGEGAPERDAAAADALGLLALVAGQDVEPAEGSDGTDGRWRIARKVAPDRVISTVDPQARHTRKSPENRRDGYRAHLAAEPQTGIITDEELTQAAGTENSDAAVAERFLAADHPQATPDPQHTTDSDDPTRQWYGDSAYGTGDLRDAIAGAGHTAVIKPKPLQAAVVGGFTVDDFTVDERAGTVTCPTGHARPISITGVATFGALCAACPLRQRCTTSKTGRKLVLGDHDALLRQARRDWAQDPHLRDDYRRHRPNVERVISQLFFFQAEDGIRDLYVTGVQTCALPISQDAGVLARDNMAVGGEPVFEIRRWATAMVSANTWLGSAVLVNVVDTSDGGY